jgi:hypothetical protein
MRALFSETCGASSTFNRRSLLHASISSRLLDSAFDGHHDLVGDTSHRIHAATSATPTCGRLRAARNRFSLDRFRHDQRRAPRALRAWRSAACVFGSASTSKLVDHDQAILARPARQDRAQRAAIHLAVDLLLEAARTRGERTATADATDRAADVAGAGRPPFWLPTSCVRRDTSARDFWALVPARPAARKAVTTW